jgi:hypothetical protein
MFFRWHWQVLSLGRVGRCCIPSTCGPFLRSMVLVATSVDVWGIVGCWGGMVGRRKGVPGVMVA